MTDSNPIPYQVQRQGFQALLDRLGVAGTIVFMQQFDRGQGDYTGDRMAWLKDVTLDQFAASIEERRHQKPA